MMRKVHIFSDAPQAQPVAAPIAVSRFRAKHIDAQMNDASGPLFAPDAPSAVMQRQLNARLHALLGDLSPEFVTQWRSLPMPAGEPIVQLKARRRGALRAWPTPTAMVVVESIETWSARRNRKLDEGINLHLTLIVAAQMIKTTKEEGSMLNPAFSLWLMGYPRAWRDAAPMQE